MAEYKFQCNSQEDLVRAVSLFTERNATLGFELEAVVSEPIKMLKKVLESLEHLNIKDEHNPTFGEVKDTTKTAISNLGTLSFLERVMPFSSYHLPSYIDRPQLKHKVPDILYIPGWEAENDFIKNWLEEMTGLHRLLLGHRVYGVTTEEMRGQEAFKIWKAMVKILVPEKYQVRKLSLRLEPGVIEGKYRYGADMFYSTDGEVNFFTSGTGDYQEDLRKFFDLNKLNFQDLKNSRFGRQ